MAQILVENIDPILITKLGAIAQQHGRSLQEELKHILEQAAQQQHQYQTGGDMVQAKEKIDKIREQFLGRVFSDSVELLRNE